jgi:hypothetical protein
MANFVSLQVIHAVMLLHMSADMSEIFSFFFTAAMAMQIV